MRQKGLDPGPCRSILGGSGIFPGDGRDGEWPTRDDGRPRRSRWVPLAALVGILFADFVSGFFHWGFDTWGGVDTPVVGKLAIRTFRHHHVDERAITTHDFVETNGHDFALAMVCASSGVLYVAPDPATVMDAFRIILSPNHHAAPHTRNYCITVGWLNGPLRAVRFFETLERVISALTGAVPCRDELGEHVALAVLAADETVAPEALASRD